MDIFDKAIIRNGKREEKMTLKELLMKMPDSDEYVILDVCYDHDDGAVTQFTYLGMPVTVTFLKHFINKDFYNKTVEYLTYNPKGITYYICENPVDVTIFITIEH